MNFACAMDILPITEKQGGPAYKGGWQKDMARRRYQKGNIRKRGKRNPVWELQWWEDYIRENGSIARRRQSAVLALVSEATRREARKLAETRLAPLNQNRLLPQSTLAFGDFVDRYFAPLFFPTLKLSTATALPPNSDNAPFACFWKLPASRNRNARPATVCFAEDGRRFGMGIRQSSAQSCFQGFRAGDEMELLCRRESGKWCFAARESSGSPETRPYPGKIPRLLELLKEPVRTTVLLGHSYGDGVGEILGLRRKDISFVTGQIRIEQAYYRGSLGSPKTKSSKRSLPIPKALAAPLARMCGHLRANRRTRLWYFEPAMARR